jgi:predicted PurR-regulated permease PerM
MREDRLSATADLSGKLLLIAAGAIAVLLFLWALKSVIFPIFLAVLVATQLQPVVAWFQSHRIPTSLSVIFTIVLAILLFAAVMVGVIGQFVGEIDGLGEQLQAGADDAAGWIADHSGALEWTETDVRDEVSDIGDRISESRDSILNGVMGGVSVFAALGAGLVLTFAFVIYMLSDDGAALRWFRNQFEDTSHRETAERLVRTAWDTLGGYVRGVVLVATFDAVLIGIALFALDVPLAAALTAMIFLLAFIPIIGAWVSGIIATLVALAGGGVEPAAAVAGVSLLVQQLEMILISPMVYRRTVQLHPIVTLASVTAGGILAGIIGAFIAVPLVATAWALTEESRTIRRESAAAVAEP